MSQMPVGLVPALTPIPFHERRKDARRIMHSKSVLHVLDGPSAGSNHEVQTRDLSMGGSSFLLRESLSVGQTCRIEVTSPSGKVSSRLCEIVRSRLLSNGKHEMAVQYRQVA